MRLYFVPFFLFLSFSLGAQCPNNLFKNGELIATVGAGVTAAGWQEWGDPDIQDHLSGLQTSGWDWYMPVLPSSDSSTWQNLYSGERIYQDISLIKGEVYRISYEYASQPIKVLFGNGGLSLPVDLQSVVWFDGEVAHRSPMTQEVSQWYDDCFLFEAESDQIEIAFGHETDGYSAIDNICLVEVSSGDSLEDINLCIGEEAEIEVDQGDFTLEWSTSDTSSSITVTESGSYWLDRSESCGAFREEFEVIVEDCGCKVYVPDTFNPGSSGIDSEFTLNSGCSLAKYEMEIYDRWGNHLFSGSNIDESWDGTYLDSDVESGVYLYKLTYNFLEDEKVSYGQINLIR